MMAMTRMTIYEGQLPTKAQIAEIEAASRREPTPDADAPELTTEQYAQMAQIARARREEQKKQVVAIRISPEALAKAKATGKGYTCFLSRLIDNAINDPAMVRKSL